MTTKKFIPYSQHSLDQEDIDAVCSALKQELITRGPITKEFEEAVATYCQVPYAVAFQSGSCALSAAFAACDLKPEDQVLNTPNTFITTVSPQIQQGALPTFVDIDPATGNMDLTLAKVFLKEPKSRGKKLLCPIHYAGIPFDIEALESACEETHLVLIEDAACALGATYKTGEPVGSCLWSDMTVFSFHPAKMCTTGEGGVVTTCKKELYEALLQIRNSGIHIPSEEEALYPGFYQVERLSSNLHMTEMQAALGLSQLKKLPKFLHKRQTLVDAYCHLLEGLEHVTLVQDNTGATSSNQLFVVLLDFEALKQERKDVMEALKEKGIGTQVHYIPLYHHPVLQRRTGDVSPYFPKMEAFFASALTLPLSVNMEIEDVERVVKELKAILYTRSVSII